MSIDLFPHNREAYDSLLTLLETERKACIIHPTGRGIPSASGLTEEVRNGKCSGGLYHGRSFQAGPVAQHTAQGRVGQTEAEASGGAGRDVERPAEQMAAGL